MEGRLESDHEINLDCFFLTLEEQDLRQWGLGFEKKLMLECNRQAHNSSRASLLDTVY